MSFRSTKDFVSFVDSISVIGGGDTAEDVIGGLRVVVNPSQIKWISDPYGTKVRTIGRIIKYLFVPYKLLYPFHYSYSHEAI